MKQISASAHVVDTSEVNGRAITTLEFDTPLVAAGFSVPWVEVAEPKAGSPYPSGLEHASAQESAIRSESVVQADQSRRASAPRCRVGQIP